MNIKKQYEEKKLRKKKKTELDVRIRRNIYNFILKHPGHHYRDICKILNLSKTNTSYHLLYLIKNGLITDCLDQGYTRYYPQKLDEKKTSNLANILSKEIPNESEGEVKVYLNVLIPSRKDKEIINLLKQPTPQMIVRFLIIHPDSSQKLISKSLNKHQTTISYHINNLIKRDIIEAKPIGKSYSYKIKDEPYILKLFTKYFSIQEKINQDGDPVGMYNYPMMDGLFNRIGEIFTLPFCAGFNPWTSDKKR